MVLSLTSDNVYKLYNIDLSQKTEAIAPLQQKHINAILPGTMHTMLTQKTDLLIAMISDFLDLESYIGIKRKDLMHNTVSVT
ncbi:hypothetical protein [Sphingobacterium sp. DR205]|uniref:hypothetical protein n=1 Tax=Sphingobacterium sp. DR205 TaxID=2713573 RepID=UPI0013E4B0E1|nr:hypothetical protein [Sphingobacterium sp. DR205]QIH32795.1 hypothetical protein G6053_07760 [Sphingobacterium sp. DR205]